MRDKIDLFLETVDEQIACRLCHAEINEELRGHIEDKVEDYRGYGLSEEEALGRAIRDMGCLLYTSLLILKARMTFIRVIHW